MNKALDGLFAGLAGLGALCLVAMLVIQLAAIAGRYAGWTIEGHDAYAGYLLAASAFLALGYTLREFKDSPQGNSLAFLILPGNEAFLELCHSPEYTATCPEDLMHTALGGDDIIDYCGKLENAGIEIWPGGWREKFSSGSRKMAFVTDPDGYEVEILEN